MILNTNGNNRMNSFCSEQNMSHRIEHARDRRYALADSSLESPNANTFCQMQSYQHLAERVRELEKEIRYSQIPSIYSSCSNVSGSSISHYSRPQNFPVNLLSPNSFMPKQRSDLSTRILERAHEIPERFWIDWQQKQMQYRIDELKSIKYNHETINRINSPASPTGNKTASTNTDNETSSSSSSIDDHRLFKFNQRSRDNISTFKGSIIPNPSQSTLDRSHLTILLPFSYTNLLSQQAMPRKSLDKPLHTKTNSISTISSASSLEYVAKIDTELNVTLLVRESPDQTNPLLYSRLIINRTIEFQSISPRKDTLTNEEMLF